MRLLDSLSQLNASADATRVKVDRLQSSISSIEHEVQRSTSLFVAAATSIQDRLQLLISTTQIPTTEVLIHASSSATIEAPSTSIPSPQDLSSQQLPTRFPRPDTQPMRMISPTILIRNSQGRLQPNLIAVQDTDFNNLSPIDGARVATLLVQLRLLLWLLQRETWIAEIRRQVISQQNTRGQSSIVLEAGVGARWIYARVIEWTTNSPSPSPWPSRIYTLRTVFLMVREVSYGGPALLEALRRMAQRPRQGEKTTLPQLTAMPSLSQNFRPELLSYVQSSARRVEAGQFGVDLSVSQAGLPVYSFHP